jgi:hypothetical protein
MHLSIGKESFGEEYLRKWNYDKIWLDKRALNRLTKNWRDNRERENS